MLLKRLDGTNNSEFNKILLVLLIRKVLLVKLKSGLRIKSTKAKNITFYETQSIELETMIAAKQIPRNDVAILYTSATTESEKSIASKQSEVDAFNCESEETQSLFVIFKWDGKQLVKADSLDALALQQKPKKK